MILVLAAVALTVVMVVAVVVTKRARGSSGTVELQRGHTGLFHPKVDEHQAHLREIPKPEENNTTNLFVPIVVKYEDFQFDNDSSVDDLTTNVEVI